MFTRLVCIGIVSFCVLSAMGQEKTTAIRIAEERISLQENIKLRADEIQEPDSVVRYNKSGYKDGLIDWVNRGPKVFYTDHYKCWAISSDHFYMRVFNDDKYEIKYNSDGLVESMTDSYGHAMKFQYKPNGYMLSRENYVLSESSNELELNTTTIYLYDEYENWVGTQRSYVTAPASIFIEYIARVDSKGRIVYSQYNTPGSGGSEFHYYIWYYSDDRISNVETDNNHPVTNNEGNFDLNINIPTDSINNGSITITLPEGFTLDKENTSLNLDFGNIFKLVITKQENNAWLLEIQPKTTKNIALKADDISKLLHVAYKVESSLPKGIYDISINSILFETPNGNIIPEPAITIPADVNRYGVANEALAIGKVKIFTTTNTLTIDTPDTETIYVYRINGELVHSVSKATGEYTITTNRWPNGIYIVAGSKSWSTKVLIK